MSGSASAVSLAPWRGALLMAVVSVAIQIGLFGPQAIVPVLTQSFHEPRYIVGMGVNAATLGMAICGLFWSGWGDRFERKRVIVAVLVALSIPSALTAGAVGFGAFTALRFAQGCLMCVVMISAMAYIGEEWGRLGTAPIVMAGFVAGNVASNIGGRMLMGVVAEYASWRPAFVALGAVNLAGGLLLWSVLPRPNEFVPVDGRDALAAMRGHLRDSALRAACGVGFLLLFGFVGTFTYVNYMLAGPPFSLSPARLGLLYAVFGPSLALTPLAGPLARAHGHRTALMVGVGMAASGIGLTVSASLPLVMVGLALVGAGYFFSQAVTTSFTALTAAEARGAAMGIYLACYYLGGIVGAFALGRVFRVADWAGCVCVVALALIGMAAVGLGWWPAEDHV